MFSILKFWKVNAHLAKHTKRSIKTSNFVFKELELDLDEDTKVLEIKLSREKRLNSLSEQMGNELLQLFTALCNDEENNVRCVIVTGKGRAYSTGRDLKETVTHTPEDE